LLQTFVRNKSFNPHEEPMGSTTIGNVTPANMTGPALPRKFRINRAGSRRVKGGGRA
jgi:hypothetical protein